MCGIAGILATEPSVWPNSLGDAMLRRLVHRGPDDHGWMKFSPAGVRFGQNDIDCAPVQALLLHRRLSILDLSSAGRQPMSTADGRYWITFNGEIYNYLELRDELRAAGHHFRTETDTEVLLAAFATWGWKCLRRLVGMFAFAILDTRQRTLTLARDFCGIKPLYYAVSSRGLAFASEIKALREWSDLPRRVDAESAYNYLAHGATDHTQRTLFENIISLPAAHFAEVDLADCRRVEPQRYWELQLDQPSSISFPEAAERLRELFLKKVSLHLRSDVPVGTALSGGIDSSSIVMAVRQVGRPNQEFHSFSYIAGDKAVDEEQWVDLVATAAGTHVHKVNISSDELVADIDRLIDTQDEPFGSTSIYAQYRVFRMAREAGIKVLLDGQGADEILAGYRTYFPARLSSLLRSGHPIAALRLARRMSQWPGSNVGGALARSVVALFPETLRRPLRWLARNPLVPAWLNDRWFTENGVRPMAPYSNAGVRSLRGALAESFQSLSLPALLRYEDRNSMAHSIESRVPFLTQEFVEFVFSLPEEFLIDEVGTSKSVFRAAMRGLVPDPILDRRDKIGFATPEKSWLKEMRPWINAVLDSAVAANIPCLNLEALRRDITGMLSGTQRYDWSVWRRLNFIRWCERNQVEFGRM